MAGVSLPVYKYFCAIIREATSWPEPQLSRMQHPAW
jgi:hypothetical protein